MSTIAAAEETARDALSSGQPRVRHLAREVVVLMAFSAVTSSALAGCLLLLTTLGNQG